MSYLVIIPYERPSFERANIAPFFFLTTALIKKDFLFEVLGLYLVIAENNIILQQKLRFHLNIAS